MKGSSSTSQKIGWGVFLIGALYMLGLGWLYSWWVVPAANQVGAEAILDCWVSSGRCPCRWEPSLWPLAQLLLPRLSAAYCCC